MESAYRIPEKVKKLDLNLIKQNGTEREYIKENNVRIY
jgi:hypothetical protein